MAPRKAQVSANEAADTILDYLRNQNESLSIHVPVSNEAGELIHQKATDVSANLHNKVTKAAAQKILKDLHEGKQIEGRASGKQWVYHALQDSEGTLNSDQLSDLESDITSLRSQTATLQASAKLLRSTLSALNSTLTTAALVTNISTMQGEREAIRGRLSMLQAGNMNKVTPEERETLQTGWNKWNDKARKMESITHNMWRIIEDAVQEKEERDRIREQLGLDE
ncbi:homologous-pairing protein-like protein 2 [Aaosphaeria arxii CBS 175.79]|uniref:Homologous-pairing protein-like protein 2 n=1 Tax=Aaosphaeria arxii CBS 175.79 TaxID=1450172 RepID=A0A6A5XFT8_9PLEO|nr:homologous-pairing protein-like protein 2 [Aaosphaeria arxii CBS 175.79]KAF2011793.1 homologous-pairing protein-like protein 2 [Aaosphaeria arxii CBS 175.79]